LTPPAPIYLHVAIIDKSRREAIVDSAKGEASPP
jgi:hypothetical protein